ncbi:CGNR zinc finger domain-containing protein [Actinomycetospora termitidis]|uniref:CGNR zinc finger domain-containing protein n=1 Tax=Actinomycetospora termitidis TaxID=3053470 RepID=A0ABT7M9T7_9PSEU|nr:CGNR zinc finger domain-containing protein [Actinomycetospora sp. Odt1-22]MDL5157211.1 CGNR zinc finger domain-containing protein [Actinomycetospora sp. Odt1-22]
MHLNPYGRDAVLLAADLANDPPSGHEDLVRRCRDAGLVVDGTADDDIERTRAVLERWVRVVDATEPAVRAHLTNGLLAEYCDHPRMTDHADDGYHLHFRDADLPVGRVLCSLIAMGTALHLAGRGMHRLGRCAVEGCERVFADVSRTGRQRYCSTACSNRDAVRRHRGSRSVAGR